MALDFGETARQLQSAVGGVTLAAHSRRQRLTDAIARAQALTPAAAAGRTAAAGRRPFLFARAGPEGLLGSIPPPDDAPADWTAVSVDGSHIDVDRHLPLCCYLINLGGCAIAYGRRPDCRLFSEPTLAAGDADLYLRPSDCQSGSNDTYTDDAYTDDAHADDSRTYNARAETVVAGPLLGALRTVREVERLADAVAELPPDLPALALLDGTLAFWDLQRGNYPGYVSEILIGQRLRHALARLRAASRDGRPVALAAYTSRPQTTEAAGAVRVSLCDRGDADCARRCNARRSDLVRCDAAAGFDDRDLFAALLEPGHRSPLYQSGRLASRFAVGRAVGAEWSRFYYINSGAEIARVEIPDWVAEDAPLLAMGHALLERQCVLGFGYPVVISEAHEQAVVSGRDRDEFRKLAMLLMEQQGLPTPESAKSVSKRLPWL